MITVNFEFSMYFDLHYPFDTKFYDPIDMINITFINNEQNFIFIYSFKTNKLVAILPPFCKRKYQFPINSIVSLYFKKNKKKLYKIIKLKNNMIYIVP